MSTIVRISETPGRIIRTTLPGQYGDAQQASQALDKILAGYKEHGQKDKKGYPWARDDKGQYFRFEIKG